MIVLYAFLLITIFLFYILYKGIFSFYLFGTLVLLPFILFIIQIIISKKLQVGFVKSSQSTGRNRQNQITLKIENRSIFPIANLMLELEYYNCLDNQKNSLKINTPVYGKNTQFLSLNISSSHYGIITLRIKKCYILDMLKLFKTKLKPKFSFDYINEMKLIIIPESIPLENNISDYNDMDLDTNEYSKEKKGNDPSEIFDIHEYKYGDRISQIHWKLSAKQNKTMVKDYSLPITNAIVLLLDLYFDVHRENYLSLYDTLIEAVSTISYYLTDNKIYHKVVWYDNLNGKQIIMEIKDDEDYELMIRSLLGSKISENKNSSLLNYVNDEEKNICGHLLYCSSDFNSDAVELLSDNSLIPRITYMHVTQDDITYSDNDFVNIINVKNGMVAQSIQNLYL